VGIGEAEMRELPKFVVERLKVSAPAALHPDADVLTAFAERALPASERAVVSEHLARCGDCRNIVALALPATEALESAGAVVGLRSRWRWPVLRGAAVAAGVIAAAAVGAYQYQRHTPANLIVARSTERVQTLPASNETKTAAPRVEHATPPPDLRLETAAPPRSAVVTAKSQPSAPDTSGWRAKATGLAGGSAGPVAGSAGGIRAGAAPAQGTKMATAERPRDLAFASPPQSPPTKKMSAPSPANPAAVPAASEVVEVQAESVTAETQASTQYAQNEDTLAPAESADRVRRAKPAASASGALALAAPRPTRNQTDLQLLHPAAPMPHWTISVDGRLQRSLDGGKTWQDVNVNGKTDASGGSMQAAIVSENRAAKAAATDVTRAKNKDEVAAKEETSAKPETAPAPVFRVVAAISNEVWAGASGGLLYHSADAGTLWNRVIPSAQGVVLSGDIIGIEFSDALHGKLTTSTFEMWTTADGGQSWRKK